MKKVLTQRHQYNVKNVSASPDLMMKMLSGNIKCIFSRFQLYARAYMRIWTLHSWRSPFLGKAKYGEKILQSSRFNVLADFYIKVFGLKFAIMKFFKSKIANQKELWNQFNWKSMQHQAGAPNENIVHIDIGIFLSPKNFSSARIS